jgi:phosphate starvation-inducible protein PhoH and related proteins
MELFFWGTRRLMNKDKQTVTVDLEAVDTVSLFGERDSHLRWIEQKYDVEATLRGSQLAVAGEAENVTQATGLIHQLLGMLKKGRHLSPHEIDHVAGLMENGGDVKAAVDHGEQALSFERRTLYLKSPGQRNYVEAIRRHDVVFGIGPAGTGKTYLAVAMSVLALKEKQVERIVLVRPAVEAGENLGFLPGGFEEKVDPYLRPLYDALRDLLGHEKLKRYMETGVIEIAPLAYMRGRTLSNSFVILDEAQNTTLKQMKMFLTRLGPNSKAVITGDVTQIDLQKKEHSGLVQIQVILEAVKGIQFCYFTEKDVVRHRLVKEILRAFNEHEAALEAENENPNDSDAPQGSKARRHEVS